MPSTIVKLSSSDARAWAHNQPVWLDVEGETARPVTREEQHAISKALERSVKIKQSFRAELPILPLNANGRKTMSPRRGVPVQKLDVAFEVTYVGEKRVVTVWNGNRRYATGREILTARLLAEHGECVLHGRNGKCIGVLRDPLIREREPQQGSRVQWSRNPDDPRKSEAQRSELTEALLDQRVSSVKRRKRTAIARTRKELYSPAQCPNDCRGFRGGQPWAVSKTATPPTEQEHHPFCKYAASWAATLDNVQTTEVLYDLDTSQIKRPAAPSEIAEADANEARTGMRQVTVAGNVYAVLSPKDAETAAREARGESEGEVADDEDDGLSLSASDDEDVEDAGDDATAEAAGPHVVPVASSPEDRENWPTIDELNPRGRLRTQGAISPRDYLSRPPGSEAPTP